MEMAAAFTIKADAKQHEAHSPSTPRASGELLNKSRHFKAISMESIFARAENAREHLVLENNMICTERSPSPGASFWRQYGCYKQQQCDPLNTSLPHEVGPSSLA